MEQTHGTPSRGLRINATTMKDYDLFVRQYVAAEQSGGTHVIAIDTTKNWTIATSAGRLVDPEKPPLKGTERFVHKVVVTHTWETKPKDKSAPKTMEDTHRYYFDVTPALPQLYKERIKKEAGIPA